MRRRLGPPKTAKIGSPYIAVNGIPIAAGHRSFGRCRAFEGLLIGVQRCGAVLPHHVVAEIDEGEPDEFGNVEYLHIAEAREGSTDARKQRADGDKNVS